jgi:hypothetical protein
LFPFLTLLLPHLAAAESSSEGVTVPSFSAAGNFSCEQFLSGATNFRMHIDGRFAFSYTNGIWEIQTTYAHFLHPGFPSPEAQPGTVSDFKRIPDGVREMTLFPNDTNSPYAMAIAGQYPSPMRREIFLTWLSFSPKPELPFESSNVIPRLDTPPEFMNDPGNKATFQLEYLKPEAVFISKLDIANNGTYFTTDRGFPKYPEPYSRGFKEFSYQVIATTNCQGINFPLKTALYSYTPSPGGKSNADVWPVVMARLNVETISVRGPGVEMVAIPNDYIGNDARAPGLEHGSTANYEILNDSWAPLSDSRVQRLVLMAKSTRSIGELYQDASKPLAPKSRLMIISALLALLLIVMSLFFWRKTFRNQNDSQKA